MPARTDPAPKINLQSERALMAFVAGRYGSAITKACQNTNIPPEFMAALIADEEPQDPTKERFEKGVYRDLMAVRDGGRDHYGQLTREDLRLVDNAGLRVLATSYGLTQILGWNALLLRVDPLTLRNPNVALPLTVEMLRKFCEEFHLYPLRDMEKLFRCWNSGEPNGETYDPLYVDLGMLRAAIYKGMKLQEAGAGSQESGGKTL